MRLLPLQRLRQAARALPGGRAELPPALPWASLPLDPGAGAAEPVAELRARLGALLGELARRAEPALRRALEEGERAWDRIDDLTVIDVPLRAAIEALRADVARLPDDEAPARAEAGLTLATAVALVELAERRLAALVRLRLRGEERALLVDGRPFLDLAAALDETARRWA